MYLGYLSFAEVEVVNEARLYAYRAALDMPSTCEPCGTLRTSLEHSPYTTPAADGAPWYDPALPESGDVAGYELLSVTGLGSTLGRTTSATSRGVSIGSIVPRPREMVLRFAAIAKNECSADYAVQWLVKTLSGQLCNSTLYPNLPTRVCGGDDMCFFTCCPTSPADVPIRLMTILKAGLVSTTVVDSKDIYDCAGHLCEVEVVLSADPYIWRSPITVLDVDINDTLWNSQVDLLFPGSCPIAECAVPGPPGCTPITPLAPVAPPTPCIGGVAVGDFQQLSMNRYTAQVSLVGLVPTSLLSAPIIRWQPLPADGADVPIMFGLSRFHTVLQGPCKMDANYFVPGYGASEELVLDTRLSAAYQDPSGCPVYVTDYDLAPVAWDRMTCTDNLYINLWVNAATDSRQGHLTVSFASQFTSAC